MFQHVASYPELYNLVFVTFSAFVMACISYFLDMCFKEGNIFENYLPWLATKLLSKDALEECSRIEDSPARRRLLIKHAEECCFWYKPLGGCPACSHIWMGTVLFWIFRWYYILPFIYIVPFLMIGNFFLRRMEKP